MSDDDDLIERARQRAIEMYTRLQAEVEAEVFDLARGWIVVCLDERTELHEHYVSPDGTPFAEPAAAVEAAIAFEISLNRARDEHGWRCWAAPLLPLSEPEWELRSR